MSEQTEKWKPGEPIPPGIVPESWHCIDCGFNTAPGLLNRMDASAAFAENPEGFQQRFDSETEVYTVRNAVWKAAGMEPFGGCLCIGCLERRLGRQLRPKDFQRNHPFNLMPAGTERLLRRRGDLKGQPRRAA